MPNYNRYEKKYNRAMLPFFSRRTCLLMYGMILRSLIRNILDRWRDDRQPTLTTNYELAEFRSRTAAAYSRHHSDTDHLMDCAADTRGCSNNTTLYRTHNSSDRLMCGINADLSDDTVQHVQENIDNISSVFH